MTRDPQAIARLIVRLHYDADFAADFFRGHAAIEVDEASATLIRALDPRAFRTDPLRPVRSLQALIDEYPVSSALVPMTVLRDFFSTQRFHLSIMARQSLALAFGSYLQDQPPAREVAPLELAIAQARRRDVITLAPGQIACAPMVMSVACKEGMLVAYQHLRSQLGAEPTQVLAQGKRFKLPSLGRGREWIYMQGQGLGRGSQPLHELLIACQRPLAWAQACEAAIAAGAQADEAEELLNELVADGLLVAGSSAAILPET